MEPNETNTEKRPLACEPSILSVAGGSADSLPPPLWGVKSPSGEINHTTLSPRPDHAIEEFMQQEQAVSRLFRRTPCQSWEGYEAEGYSVAPCDIVERVQNKTDQP